MAKNGWRADALNKNGNRKLHRRCGHGHDLIDCPTCHLFDILQEAHERGSVVIIPSGRQAIN